MKKAFSLLIASILCLCAALPAFAVRQLIIDKPTELYSSVYTDGVNERILVSAPFTADLARLTAFSDEKLYEYYSVKGLGAVLQTDYRIDSGKWHAGDGKDGGANAEVFEADINPGDYYTQTEILNLYLDSGREAAGKLAKKSGEGYVFDLEKHTLEIRARIKAAYDGGNVLYSDWTDPVAVERSETKEAEFDLPTPKITELSVNNIESNEMPYVSLFIEPDPELAKIAAKLAVTEMKYINFECEGDYGEGFTAVNLVYEGRALSSGEKRIYFNDFDLDDAFEFPVRTRYVLYEDGGSVVSEWSETQSAEIPRWSEEKGIMHAKCKVCGFCYPILGVCMFIWLGILILLAVIIAVPLKMKHNKKQAEKEAETERRRQQSERDKAARKKK